MNSQQDKTESRPLGRALKRFKLLAVLACAVLAALALSACGSSSKSSSPSSSSGSTSSASAAPKVTGATFKIGAICSCSGPQAAALADQAKVSQAWADTVNAAGGIDGHMVKMYTVDDGSNPTTALQDAKALVQNDHIQALVDDSLADASFQTYITKAGIPVVGGISPSAPFLSDPDWFSTGANLVTLTTAQFLLAHGAGKKKVGLGYCAESPICKQIVPIGGLSASLAGTGFTSLSVSATAPSYAAPCLSLKSQGVDALYVADNAVVVKRFVDGCAQEGYKPINVGSSNTADPTWLSDPNFAGTLLASTNPIPQETSNPGIAAFTAALNKYDPGETTSPNYSFDLVYPWMAGLLFQAAVKAGNLTPTSTPADVTAAMYKIKGATLDGLAPPLTYTKGAPPFITCYYTAAITSGKYVMQNGGKPTCLSATQAKTLGAALAKLG